MDNSRVVPYLNIDCAWGGVGGTEWNQPKTVWNLYSQQKSGNNVTPPSWHKKKCASAEDRTHDLRVHSATLYEVRHSLQLRIINATRHIELASEHMHDMFHHIRNCPTLPVNARIFPGAHLLVA